MKRNNIYYCRKLRKNQTEAEKRLWMILRSRQLNGVKFRRQYCIGKYILDFYAPEYKLGIEADGGQHYKDRGKQHDQIRTEELSKLGIELIRFSDSDILKNIDGICEVIQQNIRKKNKNPSS